MDENIANFFGIGFCWKQKGNKKQKGKTYNLMQCDQKTRTGGFFFGGGGGGGGGNLVLLKNRSRSSVLILLENMACGI